MLVVLLEPCGLALYVWATSKTEACPDKHVGLHWSEDETLAHDLPATLDLAVHPGPVPLILFVGPDLLLPQLLISPDNLVYELWCLSGDQRTPLSDP